MMYFFNLFTFDQWMDISGFGGIPLYLMAQWWRLRNIDARMPWNVVLRIIGLVMILTPLMLRWYLSPSLLLIVSLLMAAFSLAMLFKNAK